MYTYMYVCTCVHATLNLTVLQEDMHGQVPGGDNHWHGARNFNGQWMNYMK